MIAARRQERLRVLISGAGRGIGFACASAFAARGAELILTDHDPDALTRVSELLGTYSRYCDVVSDTSVHILAVHMEQDFDSFDVLINAAGNGFVRALGMVRMAKALLPQMRKGSGTRLIFNIASCHQSRTRHPLFPHASSEAGFRQLSDGLAAQTKGSSIEVAMIRSVPRPTPAGRCLDCGFNAVAEGIVAMVQERRPEWKPRSARIQKRA